METDSLKDHIKDNNKDFSRLNELLEINGLHLSASAKDVAEIKSDIRIFHEKSDHARETVATHLEQITDVLTEVREQVKKTNGRVSSLENYKWLLIGGMSIITMLVIPLIIYIYTNQTQGSTERAVEKVLANYDVTINN